MGALETRAAVQAERDQWAGAVEEAANKAFEMGEHAERLRCIQIVKTWAAGLKGSEYLGRSADMLISKIVSGTNA
jgi:hypothetical protein